MTAIVVASLKSRFQGVKQEGELRSSLKFLWKEGGKMREIKAIETEYKGYRFRSRLEARWAIFFDLCGARWEYEPEPFSVDDDLGYLPDFLVHDVELIHGGNAPYKTVDLWVEVKGKMTEEDADKIWKFCDLDYDRPDEGLSFVRNPVYVVDGLPDGDDINDITGFCRDHMSCAGEIEPFSFLTVDGDKESYVAYPGLITGCHRFALFKEDDGLLWCMDGEATERAFRIARQVRFDHGQTPTYQYINSRRKYLRG